MLMSVPRAATTAVMCARTLWEGSSVGAARATNSVKMGCPVKVGAECVRVNTVS